MFRGKRYIGHNPAGGAMIVLLLGFLLITTLLGLATYGAKEAAGPLGAWLGHIGKSGAHTIKEVHECFTNFTLALVIIHVAGALFESLVHGEKQARSMVNGYKRNDGESASEEKIS